jgi:hypothetical protein
MFRKTSLLGTGRELGNGSVLDDLDSSRSSMQMQLHVHAGFPAPLHESHGPRIEIRGMYAGPSSNVELKSHLPRNNIFTFLKHSLRLPPLELMGVPLVPVARLFVVVTPQLTGYFWSSTAGRASLTGFRPSTAKIV